MSNSTAHVRQNSKDESWHRTKKVKLEFLLFTSRSYSSMTPTVSSPVTSPSSLAKSIGFSLEPPITFNLVIIAFIFDYEIEYFLPSFVNTVQITIRQTCKTSFNCI